MASGRLSWWQKIGSGFHWWGQKIKQHPLIATAFIIAISAFTYVVGRFGWDWTGFHVVSSRIWTAKTSSGTTIVKIEEQQLAKTLWDWLNLLGVLAIPVVVEFGAAWFTAKQAKVSEEASKRQHETQLEIASVNQRERALQVYIDKMSELLLHENLRESDLEKEVRKIARVRTLTVLLRLDSERKRSLLLFLHESGLINKDQRIVDSRGAHLSGAHLSGADLRRVNVTREQLDTAKSLKGATIPDGSKHP